VKNGERRKGKQGNQGKGRNWTRGERRRGRQKKDREKRSTRRRPRAGEGDRTAKERDKELVREIRVVLDKRCLKQNYRKFMRFIKSNNAYAKN
jgi:hypothetical protein